MICKLIGFRKNFLNESIRIKYQADDVKKEQSGETSAFVSSFHSCINKFLLHAVDNSRLISIRWIKPISKK